MSLPPRARGARALVASAAYGVELLESRTLLASATVNWNDVRQTIDGFGVSSAWHSGTMPAAALEAAYGNTGADLSLLRIRMAPNGTTWESDMSLQAQGEGARAWSTPWSPPREWKTNHDTNNGGNLDPAHYQDYANLLADYVQDEQRQGVNLYALSIQNEPNWQPDYESCAWNADQFAAFIPFVGQTFASRGITTKIMLPESLNWNFSLASKVMADPNLAQYVGILGAHNYGETANSYQPVSIAGGKQVWETENTTDKYTDLMQNALDLADDVHQALSDANANAYHYWWLNASGPAGLFDGSWNPTKRLWVMGQYSKFARPGWVRIGETDDGGLDITTFKDPNSGKFAIVVANTSTTTAVNETFNLSGFSASSVTPWVTSLNDNLKQYGDISLTNGTSFTQSIAANSVVTYYGVANGFADVQAPGNVTATPAQGNGGSQIAVTWSDNSIAETGYTVERSTDNANWTVATSALAANTTRFLDTGLAENTKYFYRVKANNGPASAAVSTSTVLVQPRNWNLSGTRTSTGVNLTWTIPSAAATGVTLERSYDGLKFTSVASLDTRATSFNDVVPNYNPAQFLMYRLRFTANGVTSGYATWNTGLATPSGFAASGATSNSITLKWNDANPGAVGAWIERAAVGSTSWTRVSPTSLLVSDKSFTVGGLAANTSYQFRLHTSAAADTVNSPTTAAITASTVAPSVNPIVWYQADETGGTTLVDSSGGGKNATLIGTAGFTAGKTGNALTLSGGYAQLPNGVIDALGNFTVATWIKPASLDNWARVFDFGTGQNGYMVFTAKAGSTNMPRFVLHASNGTEQVIDATTSIGANVWTHVAITLNGNSATLYINGAVAGTNANMTLRPSSVGATTQNFLGKSQFSWDPTFKGSIDDFRIYERALSSSEVQALQNTAPANAAPTVATAASATPSPVTGKTTTLSVLGADDAGEAALTYTWATTGTPPAAVTFSANGTNAAKSVVATFAKAGTYNFVVTIQDAGGLTTTSSVAVVVNQTLTAISVSPSSATVNANATQQFGASAVDQFGAAMGVTPTWTATSGSITSGGLFTAPAAGGSATITATSGAVSGTASVTVVVPNAAPTVATAAGATPNPVTGTTVALSVLGADDGGEANLTYAWAATTKPVSSNPLFSANNSNAAKNTTVTFDRAGSYAFTVTISDGTLSTTSSVSVTVNQTLTSITVTPSTATVAANATQQFAASGVDQFGQAMAIAPTWTATGGSITSGGLYTAPNAAGSATIRATAGAIVGSASVTVAAPVTPNAPTNLTVQKTGKKAKLTWRDNAANETGFKVWSSRDGTNWTLVSTVAALAGSGGTATYSTANLAGGQWYLKVTAYNANGDSAASNVVGLVF